MCQDTDPRQQTLEGVEPQAVEIDVDGFRERIEECIKMVGDNAAELARMAGISPDRLYQIRQRRGVLNSQGMFAIARALGLNPTWLSEGVGRKYEPLSKPLPHKGPFFVLSDDVPGDGDLALILFKDGRDAIAPRVYRKGEVWVGISEIDDKAPPIVLYDDEILRIGKIWEPKQ